VKIAAKDKEAYRTASKKHTADLVSARELIQRIFFHQSLQGRRLASPLHDFQDAVQDLVEALGRDNVTLLKVKISMNGIVEARRAVLQELPGDFSEANKNQAEDALMINARLGGGGAYVRVTSIANENKANRAVMINAPVHGEPGDLKDLFSAMMPGGAKSVEGRGKKKDGGK
jgi:hypothetical protein